MKNQVPDGFQVAFNNQMCLNFDLCDCSNLLDILILMKLGIYFYRWFKITYLFQGQIPLSGLNVCSCDDEENFPNSFEISGKYFIQDSQSMSHQIYISDILISIQMKKL